MAAREESTANIRNPVAGINVPSYTYYVKIKVYSSFIANKMYLTPTATGIVYHRTFVVNNNSGNNTYIYELFTKVPLAKKNNL